MFRYRDCRCQRERNVKLAHEAYEKALAQVRKGSLIPTQFQNAAPSQLDGDVARVAASTLAAIPDPPQPTIDSQFYEPQFTYRTNLEADARTRIGAGSGWNRTGFGLVGPVGVGKSFAAAALLNGAMSKLIIGRFISSSDLADRVKRSWADDSADDEGKVIDAFALSPLLVIDDIDKLRRTDWAIELLFRVINRRYEAALPVIVTSNRTLNELCDSYASQPDYGPAIVDRIAEMTNHRWVRLKGPSRRLPGPMVRPLQSVAR
jgi:DNA replication protein DnaC